MQYALLAQARNGAADWWIEDTGRWFAGPDGRPRRAHGVMRLIDSRIGQQQAAARHEDPSAPMGRSPLAHILGAAIDNATRRRHSTAFLLIGIDDLGPIKQAHGLAAAEETVAIVAKRIRTQMRAGDSLDRFSDHTLGAVLSRCDMFELPIAAQRFIHAATADAVPTRAGPVRVHVSAGGVLAPRRARTAAEAMSAAQAALDRCRSTRRNGFLAFVPDPGWEDVRGVGAEFGEQIVDALNDRRIELAFEPVVEAATRRPAWQQCRMRLRCTDGSATPISGLAPGSGMSGLIDHRGLELAADALRRDGAARLTSTCRPPRSRTSIG
jgi:diguanylate cyclase (GGDEF)-like protein